MKTQQPFPSNTLVDRVAWLLAKVQLTENAPVSSVAILAQEIKTQLRKGAQK